MSRSNTQTRRSLTKAVQRYELVRSHESTAVAGKKFHFIGAGGVGMSGLAQLLLKNNAVITGSDQAPGMAIEKLLQAGADIKIGHHPANLDLDTDTVVISAAIRKDNPELKLAQHRGCKIKKYAQMLGLICDNHHCIAVAGTHGKSTTAGWLAYVLKHAGLDPNFIIGAEITQLGTSCGTGDGRYFIAEACEYDRSFLNLKPQIVCLLNIEQDHLDYYRDETEIIDAFCQFAANVKPNGLIIANAQDSNIAKVINKLPLNTRCETFGLDDNFSFFAKNIQLVDGLHSFDIFHNGRNLGNTRITLPGTHNILNALAVTAVAVNVGLAPSKVLQILPYFSGMVRRLMLKDHINQIIILDDYAHHPTEIKASLQAIRQRYAPDRIWCIFQPHQYSRTRFLLDDFSESFRLADVIIVPEIYFVRDSITAKKQIDAQVLVDRIKKNDSDAIFIDSFAAICDYLKQNVKPNDAVVTMGAGDIWKVADEYIQWLRENR